MESAAVRTERRGRKRKNDVQNASGGPQLKKPVVETRSMAFVGRYVKKEFEGNGVFLGKVVSYDCGLYRVDYEDGDCEDLESSEVRQFIIGDDDSNEDLMVRKRKLDDLISKKDVKVGVVHVFDTANVAGGVAAASWTEFSNGGGNEVDGVQVDGGADLSSDSCEYAQEEDLSSEVEAPLVPPPELPPSSGNIGVPEEYVSYLFSVYTFLRSFSIRLFLSPFRLDDFVGSLNCSVPNTLLDAIHVALMRALRRHFETLSSDGFELGAKCLRCMDWSLLDALTWPVYLVQYLTIMGYTEGSEWKGFFIDALQRDYYTLPVGRKLMILQFLCDDVLESEELRAEIDMREESEVGIDSDAAAVGALESGPRRVHPRFSKTSACKDREAMEIIEESNKTKFSSNSGLVDFVDGYQDGNGDECRLCGMDGTLLCCDGCPSAYHSRCIGVSKMFIPEGAWYCPECIINTSGPTITKETALRGAYVFGIDSYEQVFLGTCNHLVVLKVSINSEPCLRYYNVNDIPQVLQALYSSVDHIFTYSEICNRILQYWEIPEDAIPFAGTIEMGIKLAHRKEDSECLIQSVTPSGEEKNAVTVMVDGGNFAGCLTERGLDNVAISLLDKEPALNQHSLDAKTQSDFTGQQRNSSSMMKQGCSLVSTRHPEHVRMGSTIPDGSISQQANPSELTQQSLVENSSCLEYAACSSGRNNSSYMGHVNGMCVAANMSCQRKEANVGFYARGCKNFVTDCLYTGSSFKSQAYANHYIHGDFAASAAANLAILLSEENRVSESHSSDSRRKILSANVSLQVKAFSSAAVRFFWPHSERKIVEVPRERCGWCLSCKAPVASKRGCLLNSAASNAIKGAARILAGLRPVKHGEGNLPGIATYVMFMEESLCGLTIGSFLNVAYRKQWCKQVEQATTCSAIKPLLLELEENIRPIALSGEWFKLVDSWPLESSVTQGATSAVGSTQKRGPGRRGRKQLAMSEVTGDDCNDVLTDFTWWRGGMLSKVIFQKATLPHSMVLKAARQGGSRKIPGICYAEGSEIPKRSRQFAWRAAVEMSKTASQLALQVRYLDLHVRWSDLVRPDQSLQDGKGPETEASAFRNAFICDKKIVEDKIRYGVAFGNQKHLPSRVMKNIIGVEESQDGKEKYWFLETRIPLYLIKEYEENLEKVPFPSAEKPINVVSKLRRRQLKAFRKDILSSLYWKNANMDKSCCASCQLDVFLGNAVKCSACQGYCHERCTVSSTVYVNEEIEFLISCKQCYNTKTLVQNENSNESPTSPLFLQAQEFQNVVMVNKTGGQIGHSGSLSSVGTPNHSSEMKLATSDSSMATKNRRKLSWGLIWRKKNTDDTGIDFRLKNILLKGNHEMKWSGPECHLCHKPYNSELMYIRCETCTNWYHAEAVELEESRIFDLVGFKCCRCRRIRSPVCPYLDPDSKKQLESKKPRTRAPKQVSPATGSDTRAISMNFKIKEPMAPMFPKKEEIACVKEDDPLLFSLSTVEQFNEQSSEADLACDTATVSGPGPQKLPVRRHMKHDNDVDGSLTDNQFYIESSTPLEGKILNPVHESSSHVEWNASMNDFEDNMMFDYETLDIEDMEFEPQTYFSFKELLASDEGGQLGGIESYEDAIGNWEHSTAHTMEGIPEECGSICNQRELEEPSVDVVPCRMCSFTEPCPDLSCQICGLWMHSHCSPWVEESSCDEEGWRCGNCREWR